MSNNEWCDIAALRASRVDGAGERSWRVGLFSQVLVACVWGRPALEIMGLRLWVLCERLVPGSMGRTNGRLRRRLQGAMLGVDLEVEPGETSVEDRVRLVELLRGGEVEPRRLGRRVTLLGYAFERGETMRATLPSFEAIGELWGLRAENKRSAVSAAMRELVRWMVERGQLRQSEGHELTELWFAKKRATRGRYAAAQVGNGNRAKKNRTDGTDDEAEAEDVPGCVREALRLEHEERVRGVPVRAEFVGMRPGELRDYFRALEAAQERRRLGL